MARLTREQSRALTRRRLLDAGIAVFSERGFHGASIEEIADRAGFSSGAFYSNFESKEEIFLALLDERTAEVVGEISEIMAGQPSHEDLFAALRARIATGASRPGWFLLQMEFVLYCLRHPEARGKLAARERALRSAFAHPIEEQYSRLGLDLPAPVEQLGLLFLALETGISVQEHIEPEQVPPGTYVDVSELIFKALIALAQARGDSAAKRPR